MFLNLVASSTLKSLTSEQYKHFQANKGTVKADFGDELHVGNLVSQLNYYREASVSCGGAFTRLNEPLLLVPDTNIQKNMEYEHLKYVTKRDPTIEELQSSVQTVNPVLGQLMKEACETKDFAGKFCCVTHAASV